MPICFRCGHHNEALAKYCSGCNALLLKEAPTGAASGSLFNLNDKVCYPTTRGHYRNLYLERLAWAVHRFIEEEGELDPVLDIFEEYSQAFETFQSSYPKQLRELMERAGEEKRAQVTYLLKQAETLYQMGREQLGDYLERLEQFLESEEGVSPDDAALIEGVSAWLKSNDQVCLALEVLQTPADV